MIDARNHQLLQNVVRREGRSLLQYVYESFPWTTPADQTVLGKLDQLVQAEREAIAALSRLMYKRHLPPSYLGPYPMSFTHINYVSLAHLLPLLVENQEHSIVTLAKYASQIADGELRGQVQAMVDMKRAHLQILKDMAAAKQAVAVS